MTDTPPLTTPLLEASHLTRRFTPSNGGNDIVALNDVSFSLQAGETLALVGESGCGKTTLARMAGLLDRKGSGTLHLMGRDVAACSGRELKKMRRRLGFVFQDPFASLNPRMRIGDIIAEPLVIHNIGNRAGQKKRVTELLELVGLSQRDEARYPHEFSGGQRQRIALARGLAASPDLLILDEPTSALDVSIQSQILNLLKDLKEAMNLAYLFISHDLAVVDYLADRVAVLYRGEIVEMNTRETLFANPAHPYTRALMAAVPKINVPKTDLKKGEAP